MTKTEQLVDVAQALTDAQLDGVLAYARYLRGQSYYMTASADALASIDRGLADASAGRVIPADVGQIDAKIAAREQ
jgi:predicted transcriptional regulator